MTESKSSKDMGLGEIVAEIVSIAQIETLLRVSEYVPHMIHLPILHQDIENRRIKQQQLYDELSRRENDYLRGTIL